MPGRESDTRRREFCSCLWLRRETAIGEKVVRDGRKILCVGGARTAKSFGVFYREEIELVAIKVGRNLLLQTNRMVHTYSMFGQTHTSCGITR